MHYFISAGEASGDLHASQLITALKSIDSQAKFSFLGGDNMSAAASGTPIIHINQMAFMGFSEVLRNLSKVFGNLSTARKAIDAARPDALILVDLPSFNLKLARHAHRLGIPVFYFIAPKVWAWKEWRVKDLRHYVDLTLSILPFEEKYFRAKGVNAPYVGNPSREEIDARLISAPSLEEFCRQHNLDPHKPILALVPGSRRGEIRCNLPIMDAVGGKHPEYQPVIAGVSAFDAGFYRAISPFPVVVNDTFMLMHHATSALVTSGTATLECALAGTPQVVCYRANGVKLSYNIMKHLIKVPYVSLPNLIADAPIVPEMLVHLCTVESVDNELNAIAPGTPGRRAQLEGYALMRSRLGTRPAAINAAAAIYNFLHK